MLLVAFLLAGCSVGVNQQLLDTPTPSAKTTSDAEATVDATPSDDGSVALVTADAAFRSGDFEGAEQTVATVLALDPRDVDARALRAQARRRQGDVAGAVSDLGTATALAPERIDLVLAQGQVAAERPDFSVALDAFTRAVRMNPGDADAYVGRAMVHLVQAQGDLQSYQAALDDLNRAIALDPSHSTASIGRAQVYFDRAIYRGSPDDLRRTLDILDGLAQGAASEAATLLRARALVQSGDPDSAAEMLERPVIADREVTPVGPGAKALARAEIALANDDADTAATAAMAAISADPAAWSAYYLLAEAELRRGGSAAASRATESLLDRWPENGRALYLQGAALIAAGQIAEGERTLTLARGQLRSSPVYLARIEQLFRDLAERVPASPVFS